MKKINWKSILNYSLWTVLLACLFFLLGFVSKQQENIYCSYKDVQVSFKDKTEHYFVEENDVVDIVFPDSSKKIRAIDINPLQLENRITSHPSVEKSQVYLTIDGKIKINVWQKKPIARIFTKNDNFYIDEKGYLMPVSDQYTARVVVASLPARLNYAKYFNINFSKLPTDSSLHSFLIFQTYQLATFINNDKFWRAQIEQIAVNKQLEFELIPRVGNHTIVVGELTDLEEKFEKLMLFYNEGLSKTGWNEYQVINLKFKDQVVCTK